MAEASFVYVIGSVGRGGLRTYVGWTTDVARRLAQHNAGKGARSTRGRQWLLLHVESCVSRTAAMSREWHLKRDRKLRKRLAGEIPGLLAAYPNSAPNCVDVMPFT